MSTLLSDMFANVNAETIQKTIEEANNTGNAQFEKLIKNEYKVTAKPDGSGSVIMRILPPLKGFKVEAPHVDVRKHFFSYKGVVYDSICPGFFSDDCALCKFIRETGINKRDSNSVYKDLNRGVWDNGKVIKPRFASQDERWVNVYIVDDMIDPTNNGKIFQYKLPHDIIKKYDELVFGDPNINQAPSVPSDLINGRNLYVVYYKGEGGFRKYDRSKFLNESPIRNKMNEDLLQDPNFATLVQNEMQDLFELIDPETRLYSKEESEEKFNQVMEIINAEMSGGEDITSGFESVVMKANAPKTEEKKLYTEDLDAMATKEADPTDLSDIDDVLNTSSESGFGDLDDLLKDL